MLYTPMHAIPNKSHLGEGLRAFSTRGNCHPFPHQRNKNVSRMTYSPYLADGRILETAVPPTDLELYWYMYPLEVLQRQLEKDP